MPGAALNPGGLDDRPDAVRAWDRFFFTPADPTPLGLLRLAVGLLLLWNMGVLALDLHGFLGGDGWADPVVVRSPIYAGPYAWSFWFFVPDGFLWTAWTACMVVLALWTVGLFSRVTAVLAWIIVVSTVRRVPVMLFGFDQIISTWTLYLAVTGASGQAFSLDRWLADRATKGPKPRGGPAPTVSANLALRLVQLHLCLIYGVAGLSKLMGPHWWDGSAIARLLGNSEFRPIDLSGLVQFEGLINLATHATLAIEIGYPIFVWLRGFRPWVIGLALAMHLGIALTMGLWEFSLAMIAGNLAFMSGPALRRWLTRRRGDIGGAIVESREGPRVAPANPPARSATETGRPAR